ncbi:hypothetical protein [Lentibacillus amyloliquefaciens]|uniref:Uncharacterized protein n=1 Tax=Lentibacillus amyloliquefaciens TaxID=1472767 RepID=A0A0U4FE35_9BACI|nr:hypothetical protein [Lentibacillus amyloliquefaciens]ALX48765.1 hypothetical protein AOX59_09120 [Lentibacillus amyloliquefaciens]
MKWFIYMYPKSWRRRYSNEMIEVLKQTDWSFKVVFDLLLGIADAWIMELNEKKVLGFRMSQVLLLISLINVFVILKLTSLRGVNVMLEQVSLLIAMLSFFLAIVVLIANMLKVGIIPALSIKTKLAKISLSLMGSYALFFAIFLVAAN